MKCSHVHEMIAKPLLVTRKEILAQLRSPRLLSALKQAGWIRVARRGGPGRAALYTAESVRQAYERLAAGEEPAAPLIPKDENGR
jgi:hypothetical protein